MPDAGPGARPVGRGRPCDGEPVDFRRLSALAHPQPEAACTVTSKACVLRALQTAHACACGPERWHDARWAGTASGWGAVRPARLARGASAGSTPGSRCLPPSSLRFLQALVVVRHVLGQRACINVAASRASRSTPCALRRAAKLGGTGTRSRLLLWAFVVSRRRWCFCLHKPRGAWRLRRNAHSKLFTHQCMRIAWGYPRASGLPVVSCQP